MSPPNSHWVVHNLERRTGLQVLERSVKNLMLLVSLLTLNLAQADLLVVREDAHRDGKPSYAVGVVTPKFEAWTFAQPGFPLWEFGRTEWFQLNRRSGVLAGGYVSYWQVTKQLYVEPWSMWKTTIGTTQLTAKVAAYAPLNGGSWWLYSDQTAVTWPVTKRTSLGVATDWWLIEGSKPAAGIGPVANFTVGTVGVSLRALHGKNEADSCRLEVTCPF